MSHTVIVDFTCPEGVGEAFLPGLIDLLVDTKAFEGCESVETYTDSDNPDRILLWEKWATRENQEAYLAWRTETGMVENLAAAGVSLVQVLHLTPRD